MTHDVQLNSPNPAFAINFGENLDFQNDQTISKEDLCNSYYLLAKINYDKADLISAEKNFLNFIKFADRKRDIFSLLKVYGFLIRIASELEDDDRAKAYILCADTLIEELTCTLGSLNAEYFYNYGIVQNYKGEFDKARNNFLLAYRKAREDKNQELLAKCLLSLASNSFNTKNYDRALDYLHQLEQLLKVVTKSYICGSMYYFTGKIYLELGCYDGAISFFDKANRHLTSKKCWNLIGYILLGKGIAYRRKGEFEMALSHYKIGLDSTDEAVFKRLSSLIKVNIEDVNDSSVDMYLDKTNRKVIDKKLGTINFKHRFVLLEILFLLAKNAGQYFDKEQLARSIWGDEYNPLIHDKLIYTSISRLRKLIEPKAARGGKRKYIIRGKDGYAFNPMVKTRFMVDNSKDVDKTTIANVELSSVV